jgi:hypothetical protein
MTSIEHKTEILSFLKYYTTETVLAMVQATISKKMM